MPASRLLLALGLSLSLALPLRADPQAAIQAGVDAKQPEAVLAALAQGASPDSYVSAREAKDKWLLPQHAMPLLIWALEQKHAVLAGRLLELGADPNSESVGAGKYRNRTSALMIAADSGQPEMVGLLLEKGADPEALNQSRVTALHFAAGAGDLQAATLLLQKGANPDWGQRDHSIDPVLKRAFEGGNPALVRLLLAQQPTPYLVEAQAGRTLNKIAALGDPELLSLLLGIAPRVLVQTGPQALYDAISHGHLDYAKRLRARGVPFDPDFNQMLEAARQGRLDLVQWLVTQGFDPLPPGDDSGILEFAIVSRNLELVAYLLSRPERPQRRS